MLYKYGMRTRNFCGVFIFIFILVFLYFGGVFRKTIFYSRLLDVMIIANSTLHTSLPIYHLISNARSGIIVNYHAPFDQGLKEVTKQLSE